MAIHITSVCKSWLAGGPCVNLSPVALLASGGIQEPSIHTSSQVCCPDSGACLGLQSEVLPLGLMRWPDMCRNHSWAPLPCQLSRKQLPLMASSKHREGNATPQRTG